MILVLGNASEVLVYNNELVVIGTIGKWQKDGRQKSQDREGKIV
jgi:hypothetical protein